MELRGFTGRALIILWQEAWHTMHQWHRVMAVAMNKCSTTHSHTITHKHVLPHVTTCTHSGGWWLRISQKRWERCRLTWMCLAAVTDGPSSAEKQTTQWRDWNRPWHELYTPYWPTYKDDILFFQEHLLGKKNLMSTKSCYILLKMLFFIFDPGMSASFLFFPLCTNHVAHHTCKKKWAHWNK